MVTDTLAILIFILILKLILRQQTKGNYAQRLSFLFANYLNIKLNCRQQTKGNYAQRLSFPFANYPNIKTILWQQTKIDNKPGQLLHVFNPFCILLKQHFNKPIPDWYFSLFTKPYASIILDFTKWWKPSRQARFLLLLEHGEHFYLHKLMSFVVKYLNRTWTFS